MADLDAPPAVLAGHRGTVSRVLLNHRGDRLVSYSWDGTTRLWDVSLRRELLEMLDAGLVSRSFTSDDRRVGLMLPGRRLAVCEVLADGPFRPLESREPPPLRNSIAICPALPRLAVSGTSSGLEFWDVQLATRIGIIPDNNIQSAAFTPLGADLLISGERGVRRLPVEIAAAADGGPRVIVGSPETLLEGPRHRLSLDAAGRWLAVCDYNAGAVDVVDLTGESPVRRLPEGHRRAHIATISPNGKWIVTGTWHGRGLYVWDRELGERVKVLDEDIHRVMAAFSHNGRWLAASGDNEQCLWEVGSWRRLHRLESKTHLPGGVAFSADDRLLAMNLESHQIRLVDPATGGELALLEPPQFGTVQALAFDPGGRLLAVVDRSMHVWNTRALRGELSRLGLDWNSSPPQLPVEKPFAGPLAIELPP